MISWSQYLQEEIKIRDLDGDEKYLTKVLQSLLKTINSNDGIIFTAGNGGSASTAEHFSADLSQMKKRVGVNCRSICLTSNTALHTAISNDIDYFDAAEYVFSTLLNKNSLVITFSASGNSENIIRLHKSTTEYGIDSYAFLGFDGGKVRKLPNITSILFKSQSGLYGHIENLHLTACHDLIDGLVETLEGKQ